jgi:uncharacterized surface protein with fasciclin (FAS1) repeats
MKHLHGAVVLLVLVTLAAATLPTILEIAESSKNFSTLVTVLQIAHLASVLNCRYSCPSYTVFAPTNAAFAALPPALVTELTTNQRYSEHLKQLLEYHLVKGVILSSAIYNDEKVTTVQGGTITFTECEGIIKINGYAQIVEANLRASNGVVHAINNVLVPSFLSNNLVAVASSLPYLTTLVTAVSAVPGLVSVLEGGPFTIFAPDNAAFAKLGTSTLNFLLAHPNQLANILKYHVISGIIPASKLKSGMLTTVQGGTINVRVTPSSVYLNGNVQVIATNILASNGVIHVIVSWLSAMCCLIVSYGLSDSICTVHVFWSVQNSVLTPPPLY